MSGAPPAAPGATDPIRAEVEAALRAAVSAPCRLLTSLRSTVAPAVERVVAPWSLVRSVVDLGVDQLRRTVFGGTSAADPDSPAETRARPRCSPRPQPSSADTAALADALPVDARVVGDLPIDDYETLPTANVVARLERLSADELRTVEAFETANRGRRTVLGRIGQLLAGDVRP